MSETTSSSSASRIRRTPRAPARPTPSQLPYALLLLVAIVAFGSFLGSSQLVLIWIIAVALGLTLQRSRFCFTAAMRDPLLTGGTSLTKAVMVGLAVCTAGFAAIHIGVYFKGGMQAAQQFASLEPVGFHTALGAFLFGIGAVISGGCASGTLMRVGEGMTQNMIALVTFVAGSGVAAATWPVWRDLLGVDEGSKVYLPAVLGGFLPALVVQFGLLFAVWLLADWWSRRKS